eukprot:TRINITY_DN2708_c0_g1_i1.p1 TRINITY_DN2708_c0_g1~~TRINITY_DN2708_c0_g1_i1.p1  ORF type:complete len:131 (-),score=26.67 TRINITY_DN2708_c0_g1_i1:85-477(-)
MQQPSYKKQIAEIEVLGEDILTDKQQLIDFDRKRNSNRQGARELESYKEETVWINSGSLFIKFPKSEAKQLIANDQKAIDEEMTKLRDGLKVKASKLAKMEGGPDLAQSFFLKPSEPADLFPTSITHILG